MSAAKTAGFLSYTNSSYKLVLCLLRRLDVGDGAASFIAGGKHLSNFSYFRTWNYLAGSQISKIHGPIVLLRFSLYRSRYTREEGLQGYSASVFHTLHSSFLCIRWSDGGPT